MDFGILTGPAIGAVIAGFGYAVNKAKRGQEEPFDVKNFFITVAVGTVLYELGRQPDTAGFVSAVGGDTGFTALFTYVLDTVAKLFHK